ncbi:MAG: ATP-grasp domain-containing protein [Cyclobacteriaceae bacterium]
MKKVLVLFPNDWDKAEFSKEKYETNYTFIYEGFDMFKLPYAIKLPFFNVDKFIKRIVRKVQKEKIDAVLSSDEYIGAIIAAVVAEKSNLPGTDPAKIILAQHKYFSRLMQQEHCPKASVACELIGHKIPKNFKAELAYPFFVKPVKGTFSLFAKKVNSANMLSEHMAFNWYERLILKTITRPFNDLLKKYSTLSQDANFFIGEELIEGMQVTVDGFVFDGKVTICGVVDSVMFPDTNIFERFQYPSRLPDEVLERMTQIVTSLIGGIGFGNTQFNVELFYNEKSDTLHIIEINPRLSYQFGDLYENVDGMSTYEILLNLALGNAPQFVHGGGGFSCTASFVLRTFEGKALKSIPTARHIDDFNKRYSESNIKVYGKVGTKLSNEMRAIGSYRYGIVNVGAHSLLDLFSIYEDVLDSLPFSFK